MLRSPRSMTRFGIFLCVICASTLLRGGVRLAHAGPFDVSDRTWEGYSGLLELAQNELGAASVVPSSELDWSELRPSDAILLVHPDHAISSEKLAAYLGGGGRVAVVDDFGAGDRILERFQIQRVSAPSKPLTELRNNPELAIAEPVREAVAGHSTAVHATVENVERLMTNHPTGLVSPKLTPVLTIRGAEGGDTIVALAGNFGTPPRGKLFAMGDPSALINHMLRYPGNRAFAIGLIHYLAQEIDGPESRGRLIIVANRFSERGSYAGASSLRSELDGKVQALHDDLAKMLSDGLSGVTGLAIAALLCLVVGVWTTTVASRIYRKRLPSFARPLAMVSQGGLAGRVAVLAARTTPPALAVLELKSALEEGLAHAIGFDTALPSARLFEEIARARVLDERHHRSLKETLLEMANIETLMAAGQPQRIKRADVMRLSIVVFGLLDVARRPFGERPAA